MRMMVPRLPASEGLTRSRWLALGSSWVGYFLNSAINRQAFLAARTLKGLLVSVIEIFFS